MSQLLRVGYEGQRYFVGAWKDGSFQQLGWTNEQDGGGLMRMATMHPDYERPVVRQVIRILDLDNIWWMECGPDGECVSFPKDGRWQFNGDVYRPSFTPSMLESKDDPERIRHYIVTDGKVQFLSDCADKKIAGQTLELNDLTIRAWANGQGEPV